jgi:hypothetical protein
MPASFAVSNCPLAPGCRLRKLPSSSLKSVNFFFSFLANCPITALLFAIQDRTAAHIAPQNPSDGRQHPAMHGSSLLRSKDSRTLAAARSQEVAHGSGRHALEGVNDDTAGSPELHQQVGVAFGCLHVAFTALQGNFSCCDDCLVANA